MINPARVRTVQTALIPKGVNVIGSLSCLACIDETETALFAAFTASLPVDYLVKVSGAVNMTKDLVEKLPFPNVQDERLKAALLIRVLRLNCVTEAYSELWEVLFDPTWLSDEFVAGSATTRLSDVTGNWTRVTPLRRDLDRWLAAAELDALAAIVLNLGEPSLLQMYRSQFDVLRKYEYVTVFDANGRQISGIHHNYGFHQQQWEDALKAAPTRRGEKKVGMWERVKAHMAGEADVDLGPFVPPFVPADREEAMSTAYRAFQARLAAS
jgi:hypothetical protein